MNRLLLYLSTLPLAVLCGCFTVPDGTPPEGAIVNVKIDSGPLSEDAAVETMIAKFSNAALQSGLNGKTIPVKFTCGEKLRKLSLTVFRDSGPMLNLKTVPAVTTNKGPYLVCSEVKLGDDTAWTITCLDQTKELFKISVKVKSSQQP